MVATVSEWCDRLEGRAGRHYEVQTVEAGGFTELHNVVLGRSLSTFQLGESGTGENLLRVARRSGAPDEYLRALQAFVVEEQEHARLLELVLGSLGQPLRTSHWADTALVFIRRLRSLRTEVLVLLLAEVIAVAYYGALRDGVDSVDVCGVFARIHDDELVHIQFHGETLPAYLDRWTWPVHRMARVMWNLMVIGGGLVVALDHRKALALAGTSISDFTKTVWDVRSSLDEQLFA